MTDPEPSVDFGGMERRSSPPEGPSDPQVGNAHSPGLASLHAALDRVVATLGLRGLTVVLDDPDLGRQAFRAGPGPFEPGALSGPPGCRVDPAVPTEQLDVDLLMQLCAASLRVEVLSAESRAPNDRDAAELALRRLPGVRAVVLDEADDELLVVQVFTDIAADSNLSRAAARVAAMLRDGPVVVEIIRESEPQPTLQLEPTATPAVAHAPVNAPAASAIEDTEHPMSFSVTAPSIPTLVAVRSDAEAAEIEVHMRGRDVRTIGRASASDGLAGAVHATLRAVRDIDGQLDVALSWVRTIETTADRRFVVAVALQRGRSHTPLHGMGAGADALEAAARATLDAMARWDAPDRSTPS